MPGHFNLRHDGDVPAAGIGHDLANVILRIVPAISSVRAVGWAGLRVQAEPRILSPGPDLRQARILLDLDAPPLVVRQVQVQRIDLLCGQNLQQLLDLLLGEEMARHIEQQPAPLEPRPVLDLHARGFPIHARHRLRRKHFRRHQLEQRLHPIEQPGGLARPHNDRIRGHGQLVTLSAQFRFGVPGGQEDRSFGRLRPSAGCEFETVTRGLDKPLRQILPGVARRDIRHDARLRLQLEGPCAGFHLLGERNQRRRFRGPSAGRH